jgi:aspartate 1-decarboxylase
MMFGAKVRYSVLYKANQPGISIYTRQSYHNFRVTINNHNFEGSVGCNLKKRNAHVITEEGGKLISIYDNVSMEQLQTWYIPSKETS